MQGMVHYLWLVPVLPLLAAGVGAVLPSRCRRVSAGLAIGSMSVGFILSLLAFFETLSARPGTMFREVASVPWIELGRLVLPISWVLDPLSAVMLVMVTLVGTLIFVFSLGYMEKDANYTRFFCFLALFAAAMLGLVIANSLLFLFICWELVGLASYLLIGFWFDKPSAAAAAKKAFIVTRIGDVGFFLGMLWWLGQAGTLTFYDEGMGCLEGAALARLTPLMIGGWALSTAISLLLVCGAAGKSGQVPFHVWLPDAMEGPTPVSALIHAATMVAAGVFLLARLYPLLALGGTPESPSAALQVVTWMGAISAVFAALIAVAQTDIKRILAYSTVSQLGYMMMGLGVGGVGVAMFHLLTHAFFKALLFLGSGSVIHGCHEEQDIRRMGGLKTLMPVTFATYAVGMLALCGVPLFSGFWSKDGILHAAHAWPGSQWPFYLGLFGALLTAFYMTRQVALVFYGHYRGASVHGHAPEGSGAHSAPHESPAVMRVPLVVLAVFAVGLGFFGTPFHPWLQHYLGDAAHETGGAGLWGMMLLSTVVVGVGLGIGWRIYGRWQPAGEQDPDPLQARAPELFGFARGRFFVDELYDSSVVVAHREGSRFARWLDRILIETGVACCGYLALGLAWVSRLTDEFGINLGFDAVCGSLRRAGARLGALQAGDVQDYLRVAGLAITVLLLLLTWGCAR